MNTKMEEKTNDYSNIFYIYLHYEIPNIYEFIKNLDNINMTDKNGNTLLHYAASVCNIDYITIKILITHGIDINIQNNNGNTILHLLCDNISDRRTLNLIKYIVKHGADINLINKDGNSLLDIINKVQEYGASCWCGGFLNRINILNECKDYLINNELNTQN